MRKKEKPFSVIDSEYTVNSDVVLSFAILLMHNLKHVGIIDEDNKYDIKVVKYPRHDTLRDNYCTSFEFGYFGKKRRLFVSVEEDWTIHFNFSMPSEKVEGGWIMMPIFGENDNPNVISSHLTKMDEDILNLHKAIREDMFVEIIKFIDESEHISLDLVEDRGDIKSYKIISDNSALKSNIIEIGIEEKIIFGMTRKGKRGHIHLIWRMKMSPEKFFSCFHEEIEKHVNQ